MRAYLSLLALPLIACGDDPAATPDAAPDAIDYTLGEHPQLAMPCSDALADIYTLPTDLPAMNDDRRGDVFRCAKSEKLTVPEIRAQVDAYNEGFATATPGTINSGFWSYRIAYRSTRNTVGSVRAEGDTAAVLLVPARPLAGNPVIVWGHGSVGIAPKCAPSRLDLSSDSHTHDFPPVLFRLAGYGFTVVAPDYNGFSYGQAPGYFNAEDEAHAVLDATRAAKKLLTTPVDKVAFVGHSQGAHAVLSAHSHADAYGMEGTLVGVATMAPLWSSMSLFAAVVSPYANFTTANNMYPIIFGMSYAYSAGELRDGSGVSVFQAAKQDAAKNVILNECYDHAALQALGAKPEDFFEPSYVNNVGSICAANPSAPDCSDPLAVKWKARWIEDRPAIDATGAPILAIGGEMDTNMPPYRLACVRAKTAADLTAVSGPTTAIEYCLNLTATHNGIVRGPDVDHVAQWVAAKAGAGPEPTPCRPLPAAQNCITPPNEY